MFGCSPHGVHGRKLMFDRVTRDARKKHQRSTAVRPSIRSPPLERSCPTSIVERAIECIALNHARNAGTTNPSPKRQHVSGLCSNHKMLFIDRALHTARLIRPLEVACDHRPILL